MRATDAPFLKKLQSFNFRHPVFFILQNKIICLPLAPTCWNTFGHYRVRKGNKFCQEFFWNCTRHDEVRDHDSLLPKLFWKKKFQNFPFFIQINFAPCLLLQVSNLIRNHRQFIYCVCSSKFVGLKSKQVRKILKRKNTINFVKLHEKFGAKKYIRRLRRGLCYSGIGRLKNFTSVTTPKC